jgi:hypothetical protein
VTHAAEGIENPHSVNKKCKITTQQHNKVSFPSFYGLSTDFAQRESALDQLFTKIR